ncbi:MAG: phasin family protein [Rickettsiales bacterium]
MSAQARNFNNPFESWTQNMNQFSKMMPNMGDMSSYKDQASRNVEAATAANQIAVEGMQAMTRRIVEVAQQNAQNSMECFREACSSRSPEDAQRTQADFYTQMVQAACNNAREMAEMASKASMEIVDICNRRIAEAAQEFSQAGRSCSSQAHSAPKAAQAQAKK